MNISKLTQGIRLVYMNEAFDPMSAAPSMTPEQRIEQSLFGGEPEPTSEPGVTPEEEILPEGNDPEGEEEEDGDPEEEDPEPNSDPDVDEGDETLASYIGLDEDKVDFGEDGSVVFKAIVDGNPVNVTAKELVDSYQLQQHVQGKSAELGNERKQFVETRDKAYQELATRLDHANNVLELASQSLLSDFQGIDWDGLRMSDPAEWAALRQQFAERAQQVEQAKAMVAQDKGNLTEEQKQQQAQQQQEFLNAEVQKMIANNPTWTDQSVMTKEVGALGNFLSEKYGFSPEEIANNMDSRLMSLIQDAHKFHNGQAQIKGKKVEKNVPKFRKPGQRAVDRTNLEKARKAKAQKDAIRKSGGSLDSIAASLIDRM